MNVIGYVRVSTDEQGQSGAGLEAQKRAIRDECERRGWTLVHIYAEVASGGDAERPVLRAAREHVEGGLMPGVPRVLMVAKVDRLSRSIIHFAQILERARERRWQVVALDLGVDMTTPAGEMVANLLAAFAQYERRLLSERTKAGMAVKRSQGVHCGRPREIDERAIREIRTLHDHGDTYVAVAEEMNRLHRNGAVWARPARAQRWTVAMVEGALRRRRAA